MYPFWAILNFAPTHTNSSTLATWCEELTHWKRPWCWERLKAGGEGDDRGWDGWMASPTQWTWVWANSGSWWWTGRPGVLRFMGSQRVGHDWVPELNTHTHTHTHTHTQGFLSKSPFLVSVSLLFGILAPFSLPDTASSPLNYLTNEGKEPYFFILFILYWNVAN